MQDSQFKIARKIDLYFRDQKHAQIAELEIQYKREKNTG